MTETAIIKISPDADVFVTQLHDEALKAQAYSEARCIANDADVKMATNDLSILSRLRKGFEEKQKEYTDPLNEHLKAIRDTFKTFMGPLLAADATTREKILAYRHAEEEKARQIEEANRLRMEAAQLEAKASGTGEISESVKVLDVPLPQPKTVYSDAGSAGVSKNWKFEVVDFALLPADYKMVDAVKLGKVIRAGLHEIAGVRIWSEDTLRVTPR